MRAKGWWRAGGIGLTAVGVLLAAALPRPAAEAGPQFTEPVELTVEATAQPSLWYCPWVNSGAIRESRIAVVSAPDVDIAFTHPDPRVGEPADVGYLLLDGPGAALQDVAAIVNRGDAPGFVEFSDGPATASAIVSGEAGLSGDRCVGSIPKQWHLTGLTTRRGYGLTLRLFNPTRDNAKVEVRASSELGSEALPDLQAVDVIGQKWLDIDLGEMIPFLDTMAITVRADEGAVIPVAIQHRDGDEASWPGTGLSTEWTFPTASIGGLTPRLAVWNPNNEPVDVAVDLYTRTSGVADAFTATIDPGRPLEFAIGDQSSGAVAVRVRASGAIAAAVVAEDTLQDIPLPEGEEPPPAGNRIAGTVGAAQQSASWLLAGVGGPLPGEASIFVLNTTGEPVTITLQPLGIDELAADKVRLEPNSFRRIRVSPRAAVGGYRIDSAVPISASWSLQTDTAVALFAGIAIAGE